jgi:hypothetical protein
VPVGDLPEVTLHRLPEPAGEGEVQGQVEPGPQAREVLTDLPRRGVKSPRCAQDARAEPGRERVEDLVVVLAVVGDPHEPLLGRGEQQRPDGSVDGRVRDVEQAFAAGGRFQLSVQTRQRLRVRGGQGEQGGYVRLTDVADHRAVGTWEVVHRAVVHRAAPSGSVPG